MVLWVAPDQKKQESRKESKEEENKELHGSSLTMEYLPKSGVGPFNLSLSPQPVM
jgi:hypothetical protein